MSWLPDAYTIQARLRPALLVALPAGLAVVAWFPEKFVGWGATRRYRHIVWADSTLGATRS